MLMQSKKELFDIFWSIEFPACFKAFNHIFLLKAKFLKTGCITGYFQLRPADCLNSAAHSFTEPSVRPETKNFCING